MGQFLWCFVVRSIENIYTVSAKSLGPAQKNLKKSKIQGVHKLLLQFKKLMTKAVDEISYIDLFFINQCLLKFLFKLKIFVSD